MSALRAGRPSPAWTPCGERKVAVPAAFGMRLQGQGGQAPNGLFVPGQRQGVEHPFQDRVGHVVDGHEAGRFIGAQGTPGQPTEGVQDRLGQRHGLKVPGDVGQILHGTGDVLRRVVRKAPAPPRGRRPVGHHKGLQPRGHRTGPRAEDGLGRGRVEPGQAFQHAQQLARGAVPKESHELPLGPADREGAQGPAHRRRVEQRVGGRQGQWRGAGQGQQVAGGAGGVHQRRGEGVGCGGWDAGRQRTVHLDDGVPQAQRGPGVDAPQPAQQGVHVLRVRGLHQPQVERGDAAAAAGQVGQGGSQPGARGPLVPGAAQRAA